MKRLILLPLALLTTMMSWAIVIVPADFRVITKDGSVAYFSGYGTELTFNAEGTVLTITTEGTNSVVSYAVDGIEAIEFDEAGAHSDKYSYDVAHIDVTIDSSDEASYSEIEEVVIDDENDEDYGDFIENYAPNNTVVITYNGDKVTFTGNPSGVRVVANGAHVVVYSTKGKIVYTLKGTTTNGSFKLYSEKKAQITLNGVNITNPKGAAVNIQSGKTMLIKLADGTTNYLEDGSSYTLEGDEQQKGTFFSEEQLVFSGKGALEVKSNYGHGIASDDYVRVRDGYITINSVRDGISTKDRFIMYGGELAINAGQDGVDVGEGYVEIGGGKLNVQAGDEGITASYEGDEDTGVVDPLITPYIDIKGGLIKVNTTGDKGHGLRAMSTFTMSGGIIQATTLGAGSKAIMSDGDMSLLGGKITAMTEGDALYEEDSDELSSSAAIRSKGLLTIKEMTMGLKCTGKGSRGINSESDITIEGSGVTVVAVGEDHKHNALTERSVGISTDCTLNVQGGRLLVRAKHAAIEAVDENFTEKAIYESVTTN